MELKWLEDFLSVAATRSFSRSAEERRVTQPAFSRRIKALEMWVGTPLVDRSTYPTTLTQAGETFRESAADTLRELLRVRDDLRNRDRLARSTIGFAALHTLALTFYPRWLTAAEEGLGALNTRLTADNLHDCVQALVVGDCDFLLSYAHPAVPVLLDPGRFPSILLAEERIVPAAKAGRDRRPLHKLPGTAKNPLPYLAYSADCFLGRIVELILARSAVTPHLGRCYENSMAEALKAMALQGRGLAWLPESAIRADLEQRRLVRAADAKWELTVQIRLYRSAHRTRREVERFWSFVSENGTPAAKA